jgi:hypothetical protein
MREPGRSIPSSPEALLTACRRLLRPLVRLLMRAGVTFPVLAELIRTLYVEVALRDVLMDPKARSDSRVSLLTGVHRKEIRRLRLLPRETDEIPQAVTISSQVIARWVGLPAFTDGNGRPRPLARATASSNGPTFDALVESVTTDVRPRAVLDEWLSQGVVTVDEAGLIHLNTSAFIPRGGSAEQMFYFARNLHDHIAAAAANVSAEGAPPYADRSLHYDELDEATARTLEQLAREAAQRALLEVNRAAIALVESMPDASPTDPPRVRINFGIYIYREEGSDDGPSPA